MPVDYLSTNFNFSQWPSTSQILLSSNEINSIVLELTYFNPLRIPAPGDFLETRMIIYSNDNITLTLYQFIGTQWAIASGNRIMYGNNLPSLHTFKIPYKNAGLLVNWYDARTIPSNSPNVLSLSIQPVISAISPWEKRRIAGGTG